MKEEKEIKNIYIFANVQRNTGKFNQKLVRLTFCKEWLGNTVDRMEGLKGVEEMKRK